MFTFRRASKLSPTGSGYWLMTSGIALSGAVAIALVLATSSIGYQHALFPRLVADAMAGVYALILIAVAFRPLTYELHKWGAILGFTLLFGRGGGFLQIVLLDDREDIVGTVAEHWRTALIVLGWHVHMGRLSLLAEEERQGAARDEP